MGVSTDAILVFGVPLPEEHVEYFKDPDHEDELEQAKKDNPLGYMAYMGEADDLGVQLQEHCSDSCTEYIAHVRPSIRAWRGQVVPVAPETLALPPAVGELEALRKFCERHNIEFKVGWWLVSWWG